MRIAQIMLARGFGGAERSFVDLTRALAARGHEVLAIGDPRGVALDKLADVEPPEPKPIEPDAEPVAEPDVGVAAAEHEPKPIEAMDDEPVFAEEDKPAPIELDEPHREDAGAGNGVLTASGRELTWSTGGPLCSGAAPAGGWDTRGW